MRRQLMPEKIKIDPGVGGSALGAAQHTPIKAARLVNIPDVEG